MPRIRAVHPRAPHDEDVASMPIAYRYLWDRLSCYADREGRLEDRPLMLKGEVFPADDVDVNQMLTAFADRGFIIRYTGSNGRRLIQIVSFHDYQRPDRKERDSVLPPPDGWTGDKRGKWVWDKTQGSAAGSEVESGNNPVPLDAVEAECAAETCADSAQTADDRPRARSGNPVIRYSGDPPFAGACARSTTDARIRPRTACDLEHCLRVAIQREQPQLGLWNPGGSFAAKEAREFLEGFGGELEEALGTIEARIDLFAKDKSMAPWTIKRFAAQYNAIGIQKSDHQGERQPRQAQARY